MFFPFMSRFFKSFGFAFSGLKQSFKAEVNLKVHLIFALLVLLAGWCFDISKMEWVAVVICIGCVFAMELVNTAIERLVDLVSPKFNAKAGLVKDIAAAAVLIASMMSLAVGLIIFVPKIFC